MIDSQLGAHVDPARWSMWPDAQKRLLLAAALLPADRVAAPWRAVRDDVAADRLDGDGHRLLPLVASSLAAAGIDDPLIERLRGHRRHTWAVNQMRLQDAAAVLTLLRDAGIPTMIMKGTALVVRHYADAGLRPMMDVDILVPGPSLQPAADVLVDGGYARRVAGRERQGAPGPAVAQLVSPDAMEIDVHGEVAMRFRYMRFRYPRFRFPRLAGAAEPFWDAAVPVTVRGAETTSMGDADLLVHAFVHAFSANSERTVRWIPDAVAIVRSSSTPGIDWDRVVEQATRFRATLLTAACLEHLVQTLELEVPAETIGALRSITPGRRERIALRFGGRPDVVSATRAASSLVTRYVESTSTWPLLPTVAGFGPFVAARWDAPGVWQLPAVAVRRIRAHREGRPLAPPPIETRRA